VNVLAFELPASLEAREPPEARGVRRDDVRLMVASRSRSSIAHARFRKLPQLLTPGDLLVINVSATLPAAVQAWRQDGSGCRVHFATQAPELGERWRVVELRTADGARPIRGRAGERIKLPRGAAIELIAPYASGARLLLARFEGPGGVEQYLARHGEPIRYGYVRRRWPLAAYQNVYATTPGSAEMPSAGRPLTAELITALVARGILIAPITLHTGVSSPEAHEPPFPEQFVVPEPTARLVGGVRVRGGRVIAVGTTVVRALETVAGDDGTVRAGGGWTGLVIDLGRGLKVVDGLITGWHEPHASHLQMLEAIAGSALLSASYDAAVEHGYLWHEFGDSHLILP
jgi:S-adenosylmethionine:tRNA ribosyltransferase-isomerase